MKVLVLLFCLLASVVALDFANDIKLRMTKIMPECIAEVGANEEDVAQIIARKEPTSKEGKCLASCLQKKFGLQNENGEPSRVSFLQALEPLYAENPELYTKLLEIGLKCGPEVRKLNLQDHCNVAVEMAKCAVREARAVGIDNPFMF